MHTYTMIAAAIAAVSETSAEALRDELGREPTQDERRRLEAAIRERLDAAAEAAS